MKNRSILPLLTMFIVLVAGWAYAEEDSPESYAVAAKKLYEKGDLQGALLGYDKAISLAQKRPAYYYERALVKMGLGKPNHAVVDLSIATTFDEKFSEAWHLKGRANYVAGNYEEAAHAQYVAVLLDKDRADYWLWAGISARKIGDDGSAISYLNKSIELKEDDPQTWYQLGLAYAAERKPILAADKLTKAVELDKEDPVYYKARAFCYLQAALEPKSRNDFLKAAEDDIATAWKLQPDIPDRRSLRATLLYMKHGPLQAVKQLNKDLENLTHMEKAVVQMRIWALYRLSGDNVAARGALKINPGVLDIDRRQLLSCLLDRMNPSQLNNQVYDIDLLSERWFFLGIKSMGTKTPTSTINLELCSVRPFNFEGILSAFILAEQAAHN